MSSMGPDGSGGPSLGWQPYRGRGGRTVADGVSDVWFRVTDLEVASGSGCVVTTTDGDRVPRLLERHRRHEHRALPPARGRGHPGAGGAVHPRPGQRVPPHPARPSWPAAWPPSRRRRIDTFFFANSGAEATEAAVKLAKQATGRPNVIVFQGSFHGRTHLAMAMTTSKTVYRAGHAPLPSGVFVAPFPKADGEVDACLDAVRLLLLSQTAPAETAAMLIEPVLGEGGYVPAPTAFLQGLEAICREHGILFVADEVQSGFGRTGHDVLRRAARHPSRRRRDGQGPGVRLPDLRRRGLGRADGPLAHRQPRRHLRRQPDRLRGRHRHHRRAHRARLPRRNVQRAGRAAASRAAQPGRRGRRHRRGARPRPHGRLRAGRRRPRAAPAPSTASTRAASSS